MIVEFIDMCDTCDDFEAQGIENPADFCPACGEMWIQCFNCGANSAGYEECPHCAE